MKTDAKHVKKNIHGLKLHLFILSYLRLCKIFGKWISIDFYIFEKYFRKRDVL